MKKKLHEHSHVMRRTLLAALLGFSLSLAANMEARPSLVKSADTGRYCCNKDML